VYLSGDSRVTSTLFALLCIVVRRRRLRKGRLAWQEGAVVETRTEEFVSRVCNSSVSLSAAGLWKSVSKVTGSYEVGAVVPPG